MGYPPIPSVPAITDLHYHQESSSPSSNSYYNQTNCHGILYTAALSILAALFVLYLGFHLKKNIKKLNHRRSHVMIAYYLLLWFSAILNLTWCCLQVTFGFAFWRCYIIVDNNIKVIAENSKTTWLSWLGFECINFWIMWFCSQICVCAGMAVHSREEDFLEFIVIGNRIWNTMSRDQLGCFLTSGKLCKWVGNISSYFLHIRADCWSRYTP